MGQTLAKGFAEHKHDVMIGTRTPDKPEFAKWKASVQGSVAFGTFAATAKHGEVVVLCCLGTAVDAVLDSAGTAPLKGKVLIDATNPLTRRRGCLRASSRDLTTRWESACKRSSPTRGS